MIAQFISTYSAWIALAIMALIFVGFVLEKYPPEVTAAAGAALFVALGLVTPREAYSVFSNSSPLTIAAMFIMTGALVRTGVLERLVNMILNFAGSNATLAILCLFGVMMLVGGFINNTPMVLLLIPMAIRIANKFGIAATRLLIPVSYVAILSGTLTLIGTAPNLLADGVARQMGLEPFGIFEITPVGIITAISGLALLGLLGRFLLPDRPEDESDHDISNTTFLSEVTVLTEGDFTEKPVGEISALKLAKLKPVGLRRKGVITHKDIDEAVLQKGDTLIISASPSELLTLADRSDLRVGMAGSLRVQTEQRTVVEAVLAPNNAIVGRELDELAIGSRFGVRVLGIHRHGHTPGKDLSSTKLRAADRLMLEGTSSGLAELGEKGLFVSTTQTTGRAFRSSKAPYAIIALLAVVALAAFDVMDIGMLSMIACAALLILRCLDADETLGFIDGSILLLIFSMLIVGIGLNRSGALDMIVGSISPFLQGLPPIYMLLVAYLLTSLLTELISSSAIAVIMTPVVINLAEQVGVDPRPMVVAVMFAASASFATPVGYPTNTLVYAAGNYRFMDFVKVGLPMNIVVGVATCLGIYFVYGL